MKISRTAAFCTGTLVAALLVGLASPASAAGSTYWVDASNAACSNAGGGSQATPYCSISAAAKVAVNAGDTVQIAPGTYREQVTVGGSGASGSPISFVATGSGVSVLGTLSLSDPALWTAVGDGSWTTPYAPPSNPRQVFVDGSRLTSAPSATSTTAGSYFYDSSAKVLSVNIGGGNPGNGHQVEAGAQSYGFNVSGRSDVVISGVDVQGANWVGVRVSSSTNITVDNVTSSSAGSNGILVESSSGGVQISNSRVSDSLSVGIKLNGTTGATVSGNTSSGNGLHGIALSTSPGNSITRNQVDHNVSIYSNNTALGIDVNNSSPDNLILGNRAWANQDSGIQIYNGSNNCVVARNVSWSNGDHGMDTLNATGVTYLNNTAVGNYKDGISVEGNSTGATLRNNILIDNGLTTAEYNIYVDAGSFSGYSANYDMVFNHSLVAPIKANGTIYSTLADFVAATGLEKQGLAQDADFVNQSNADFHPTPGSPAQDSANSGVAGFVSKDADGQSPVDDPIVPDTGVGPTTYADRGAFEVTPVSGASNYAPHAVLVVDPTTAAMPPTPVVSFDASGSGDADSSPIAWYRFFFGDGTSTARTTSPTTTHTYTATGTYSALMRVGDTAGATTATTVDITITNRALVTYHVEGRSMTCSDAGPGTATQPLCTIGAAMSRVLAGDTVLVGSGIYREQVRPSASGEAGAPITVTAADGASIVGTDAIPAPAWTSTSTTAWQASYTPQAKCGQVFVDGLPLDQASSASAVAPGQWFYDAGTATLTVDIGGGNPGSGHTVEAGSRNFGILARQVGGYVFSGFLVHGTNFSGVYLDTTTDMQIDGFTVRHAGTYGVQADASTNPVITSTVASKNGSVGVRFWNSIGGTLSNATVDSNGFHGVSVQGSDGVLIDHVIASHNLRPGTRVATGIDVSSSSTNTTVQYSRSFANDDSGIEAYLGSDSTLIRRNVVYDNGDHGIDSSNATRTSVISNTVVGNATAGINFEGGSTNGLTANNVTMDNAVGSTRTIGEIRVDESSQQGTVLNHDLVFQSNGGPLFEWQSKPYTDLPSFQAVSGQESNGLNGDPSFVDLAGRDFHILASSPAVDSADSTVTGWLAADFDAKLPGDVASVTNTGLGTPDFADRGAYEYGGPAAVATVSQTSGSPILTIDVDGSQSVAGDSPIVSYAWDCGNGATFLGASGQCVYDSVGDFPLSLAVTDADGLADTWRTNIHVFDAPPNVVLTATPSSGIAPETVVLDASGSTDTDFTPISGYRFDCGNGSRSSVQTSAAFSCTYTKGATYTASATVYDTSGQGAVGSVSIFIAPDQAPNAVLRMSGTRIKRNATVTADGSASTDTDHTPIAAYRFDCGNGSLTGWQSTPTSSCRYWLWGTYTVRLYVRDTAGLIGTDTARVRVR